MQLPNYNSPTALKAFLEERGMAMQKKFGQNFLINEAAREKLFDILSPSAGDKIWEVGPGLGAMTAGLLKRGGEVTAFEIDRGFCAALREIFGENPHLTLIEGDALKTWRGAACANKEAAPLFFGNLPYNIAATLLGDLTEDGMVFPRALVTVQREVAERICAKPSSESYSRLSVALSRFYESSIVLHLAAGNFWPRPNVASAAVLLKRKEKPLECKDNALFFALARALFSSRRKTAKNALLPFLASCLKGGGENGEGLGEAAALALKKAGIPEGERPENLPPEAFCALADAVWEIKERE